MYFTAGNYGSIYFWATWSLAQPFFFPTNVNTVLHSAPSHSFFSGLRGVIIATTKCSLCSNIRDSCITIPLMTIYSFPAADYRRSYLWSKITHRLRFQTLNELNRRVQPEREGRLCVFNKQLFDCDTMWY